MKGKALAAFVAVWMVLIVAANSFLFSGDRTTPQIVMSNIGILIALWIAFGLVRRGGSSRAS